MNEARSRREFLLQAIALGAAAPLAPALLRAAEETPARKSPNEKLNLGIIGVDGRGGDNLNGVSSENIVALCDIDRQRLANAKHKFPQAVLYEDFRRVLDHVELDAVVVSTPDHMHAIPAAKAMKAGFDVYCEKPLAHSVHEVRTLRELSVKHGRVTQMGTQIHAGGNYRRAVEIVRSGMLGPVKRVHVWMGGRPNAGKRVADATPPEHVNYDLWLGPAPFRPYHPSSFHYNWRYWFDFGNGMLGDFGCHYMDLPFWALGLHAPKTVESKGKKDYEGDNDVPGQQQVEYEFPERGDAPPVHLTWYHGGLKPEGAEVYKKGSAVLFEGEKARLLADYDTHQIFAGDGKEVLERPAKSIPDSIGHHKEWIEAVKSRGVTTCNFDYSGELAEAVLLGNVSYRIGEKKIEWDARALKVTNAPEAAAIIRREYRRGWTM